MSDKFSLKWNDFQSVVSQSFSVLRREEDFFDVTLVSDDEVQISAHKLVLSACSDFFKSILKRNSHSHPLLYLSGVDSTNLSHILDYIYQGEVQVYQEHLDSFLEVAQKLRIEGLINDSGVEDTVLSYEHDNTQYRDLKNAEEFTIKNMEYVSETNQGGVRRKSNPSQSRQERTVAVTVNDNSAADEAIKEHLGKENGVYYCKVCNYMNKNKTFISRHIETHIEGLSYPCTYCEKTFRSRESLRVHQSKYHK